MKTKRKINKKKIIFILLGMLLIVLISVFGINYLINSKETKQEKPKVENKKEEEKISILDTYNYKISDNATEYEKNLFKELETILNKEEVNFEEYATILSKIFISDLLTLNTKKSSSDITSMQYIYDNYREYYKKEVMDTIYSTIELNLDGKRTQELPTVKEVKVSSITNEAFSINKEVVDSNAFKIKVDIEYEKDLDYPTNYTIIMIKNEKLLQVVKVYTK
jgi:hypothetical protein